MGFPVFRTRGDYLAIVTLGFGEVVRVIANNTQSITNGPLGLKGIADYTNIWWAWGFAIITVFLIGKDDPSSYGMAMKAVKFDQAAAEAVGINTYCTRCSPSRRALLPGGWGRLAGPPDHDDLAGSSRSSDLQPVDHHRGRGVWEQDRSDHCRDSSSPGGRGAPVLREPMNLGSSRSRAFPACGWSSSPSYSS